MRASSAAALRASSAAAAAAESSDSEQDAKSSDSGQQNDHPFRFVKDGATVYQGMVHCENDYAMFAEFVLWNGNVPAELNYHFENDAWLVYVNGIFEGDSEEAFLYDGDVIEFRFNEDFVHDICKEAANDADVPFEPATYSNLMCF